MSSFPDTQCPSESRIFEVRRSGRKKTKPNHRKNPLLQRPIKQKHKKLTNFKPSRKFDAKSQQIKLSPYENSKRLNSIQQTSKQQVLQNMKQAIKEQQTKLKRLFSISMDQEKDLIQEKVLSCNQKQEPAKKENTRTSISEEKINSESYESEFQVKKDLMQIGTAEQIEYVCDESNNQAQDSEFMAEDGNSFFLSQIPAFKKESSKLFSDNYENQELLYTIDHIFPNWHAEENDLHGPLQFSND